MFCSYLCYFWDIFLYMGKNLYICEKLKISDVRIFYRVKYQHRAPTHGAVNPETETIFEDLLGVN